MLEPFRFGLITGVFLAALFVVQIKTDLMGYTIWRWVIGLVSVILFFVWRDFKANHLNRTFRLIWFSGFTKLIAAVISFCVIVFILQAVIWKEIDKAEISYILFIEFINQLFLGVIILSLISALFIRGKIKPNH